MSDLSNPSGTGKSKSSVLVIVLSLIIIILATKVFLDYREKIELDQELADSTTELGETKVRLEEIKQELDNKIAEIGKLGGDIEELKKAKAEVESTLKKNRAWSNKNIKELKDRVEGYERLLKIKDQELEDLKMLNEELYSENSELRIRQNKLNDSIARISKKKEELAGQVAIASQLKAENIRVSGVGPNNREKESPFRGRSVGKIKVQFNLAENKVAPLEGKKILIRVLDESNQVIFDLAKGSGTFRMNGREEWYTASKEILFDNTRQELSFEYDKGSDYAAGNYTLEIYADNYRIGTTMFIVK